MSLRFVLLAALSLGSVVILRANEATPSAHEHAPADEVHKAPAAEKHAASTTDEKATSAEGAEAKPDAHGSERQDNNPAASSEISDLIKYAEKSYNDGRLDMALIAYRQLLSKHLTRKQERVVLIGYARSLRKKGDLTKAAAVYEKLIREYTLTEEAPEIYLELGRTHRALGSYKLAIARFYSVINSTIKLPENGADRYRQLAKTAQFEIAETHFQSGNYTEAARFYGRLRLLDLAETDRAKAHFKSAYSLWLAEDHLGAITSLRGFLEQHPDDENVPEAHYLLAVSYSRLQRPMEALVEAIELLRMEKTRTAKDPKRWAYWQRKTGNQIANEFYEHGDAANALAIYQTLAELSSELGWNLPILYQIGVCQERLGNLGQAIASYQSILDKLGAAKGDGKQQTELADVARMASWRLGQINWQHKTEQELYSILPKEPEKAPAPKPGKKNDDSGNTPKAPNPVR